MLVDPFLVSPAVFPEAREHVGTRQAKFEKPVMAMDRLLQYWGKSGKDRDWHPLAYHQLDVSTVGLELLNALPTVRQKLCELSGLDLKSLRAWLGFFLAIHDLGKFTSAFQQLRPDLAPVKNPAYAYRIRHDTLGHVAWGEMIEAEPQLTNRFGVAAHEDDLLELLDLWAQCVTGHHGAPPEKARAPLAEHASANDIQCMKDWLGHAADLFLPADPPVISASLEDLEARASIFSWYLAGLSVLADWLGSNREHFEYQTEAMPLEEYWKQIAQPRARKAVADSGLIPAPAAPFHGPGSLFDFSELTPLQMACLNTPIPDSPQLHILEDVTGAGKTEAAMLLLARMLDAGRAEGAYIALPTMATANAMYERTAKVYRRLFQSGGLVPSLVLAHGAKKLDRNFSESIFSHTALASEGEYDREELDAEARCNAWLADNNKRALLAQIGVGTIDQALLAVLQSRHQTLRLLGLLSKVLIVDEVHASDDYMHALLCELLQLHAQTGGSAILLSATLPDKMRQELVKAYAGSRNSPGIAKVRPAQDYPLLTSVSDETVNFQPVATRNIVKRRLEFRLLNEQEKVDAWIENQARQGQCVAWVRNTVNDAVGSWQSLVERLGPERVTLFHARFTLGDRLDIEQHVLESFGPESTPATRTGRVVIATQVIEQSLDLDFDEMVSDLAPVDLLIQRAGRLRRHPRDSGGNCLDANQPDQRGTVCLHVLAPPVDPEAGEGWIRVLLPGTAAVYRDHGQLWLTASELNDRGEIEVPDDLRDLIESVFAPEADHRVPDGLQSSWNRAHGKRAADRSVAAFNKIKIDSGYSRISGQWQDDSVAPTRLGEPTVKVRLGRWRDGEIVPWYAAERNAWAYSEVSVLEKWAAAIPRHEPAVEIQIEVTRGEWPRALRARRLLVLGDQSERPEARAEQVSQDPNRWTYCRQSGLIITSKTKS